MPYSAAHGADVLLTSRPERAGCVIAVLRGELDTASAPDLREELLGLLRPGASRLIIDLSAVGYADTSGVAVLVGTGRRARLLGGWLRLVSPAPQVTRVLSVTGLDRRFATFPTVEEAITGCHPDTGMVDARTGIPGRRAHIRPVRLAVVRARRDADGGELSAVRLPGTGQVTASQAEMITAAPRGLPGSRPAP